VSTQRRPEDDACAADFPRQAQTTPGCGNEVCITCSDQLLALVVTATDAAARTARGSIGATVVEVSTDLCDRVAVGDVLLCHGGVALQHGAPVDVVS
jgi:hypothetical protein